MIQSKRQAAGLVIGTLLFAISAPVYSIGILDAYSLALEKDPTFRAAIKRKKREMRTKTSAGRAAAESVVELSEFAAQLADAKIPAERLFRQCFGGHPAATIS